MRQPAGPIEIRGVETTPRSVVMQGQLSIAKDIRVSFRATVTTKKKIVFASAELASDST